MSVLFGRSAGFDRLVLVFGGFRVFAVFTYLLEVSGVRSFRFLLGGVLGSIVSVLFGRFPRFDRFGFVCELFLGRLLTMIVLNYLLNKARRKARHGMARQGKAKQGTAWQGWAGQCHKARQSRVRQGKA